MEKKTCSSHHQALARTKPGASFFIPKIEKPMGMRVKHCHKNQPLMVEIPPIYGGLLLF